MTLGFAGLTHLGIVSAVASAAQGFPTIGYHQDFRLINDFNRGILPVLEPGLPELLAQHRERLTFHSEASALLACDIVYIAVDVPTDDHGKSDLAEIRDMINQVSGNMRADALMVVLCQAPPGFTRGLAFPRERLFYQVETLIFGRAVERAMQPERFIIGCDNPAVPLPAALQEYLQSFGCPIQPMCYESAELAKISINLCLVSCISVANTMAEICEHVGADWSEVVPALRMDKRIGPFSYLSPGLGISGGNLERDLATVLDMAETHGTDAGVVSAWLANSGHRKEWPFNTLRHMVLSKKTDATVAVLGLAYKENTRSTKNSPALALIDKLLSCRIKAYDPVVPASAVGAHLIQAASALDAAEGADALLIMTPWPEFRDLDPSDVAGRMKGSTVIDPYRMLDASAVNAAGLDYAALGMPLLIAGERGGAYILGE